MRELEMSPNQGSALNLETFKEFKESALVRNLVHEYENRIKILAHYTVNEVIRDLEELNTIAKKRDGGILFTSVEGRVKETDSYLRKIYKFCQLQCKTQGMSSGLFKNAIHSIHDIAGVRFACSYCDELTHAIQEKLLPFLEKKSYGIDLTEQGLKEKNFLEDGDTNGYRAFHFYVQKPTRN